MPQVTSTTDRSTPKLLALDVDGTIAPPGTVRGGDFDPDLLDALNRVSRRGTRIVLATGRNIVSMRGLLSRLDASAVAVLTNGTVIRDQAGGRVVRVRHLGLSAARRATTMIRSHGMHAIWIESPHAADRYLVDGPWWTHQPTRKYLANKPPFVRPLLDPIAAAPPVDIFALGSATAVAAAEAALRWELGEQVSLVSWWSERLDAAGLEVLPPGVTKGEAVAWLANVFDITNSQAMAVGDDRNDIEMLRWAGSSVAIAGAPPDVIAAADRVVANEGEGAVRRIVREIWGV